MKKQFLQEDPNLIEVVFIYEGNNEEELQEYYILLGKRADEWKNTHKDFERWTYLKNKFDGKAISMTGELFGKDLQRVKENKAANNRTHNSIGKPMNLKPETKAVVMNMLKEMNFWDNE